MPLLNILAAVQPGVGQPLVELLLPVGFGFLAIFLLLPRIRPYPALWGAAASAAALLLTGHYLIRLTHLTPETFLFYAFSAIAIVGGGFLVTQRNPAHAALSFALVILSTCGLFLLQAAPFLMAATMIVYAGAIVVTFLFVLMLAQQEGLSNANQRSREPLLSCIAGFVLLGGILYLLGQGRKTEEIDRELLRQGEVAIGEVQAVHMRLGKANPPSSEEIGDALNKARSMLSSFSHWREKTIEEIGQQPSGKPTFSASSLLALYRAQENADMEVLRAIGRLQRKEELTTLQPVIDRLTTVQAAVLELRDAHLMLPATRPEGSGPIGERDKPRYDEHGRPQVPAANVAALGQSLFTDYLVAVELGGTLLLVATVGAIAIANRREEKKS